MVLVSWKLVGRHREDHPYYSMAMLMLLPYPSYSGGLTLRPRATPASSASRSARPARIIITITIGCMYVQSVRDGSVTFHMFDVCADMYVWDVCAGSMCDVRAGTGDH